MSTRIRTVGDDITIQTVGIRTAATDSVPSLMGKSRSFLRAPPLRETRAPGPLTQDRQGFMVTFPAEAPAASITAPPTPQLKEA